MNNWNFVGRIGKDAELRTTQSGTRVRTFTTAVDAGYGDNKKTTWVRCSLFGKRAEGNLVTYLVKGQQVAVSGELSLDEWTGQDGQKNALVTVRVNDVTLVGEKKSGGMQQQAPQQPQGFQQQPQYNNQAPQGFTGQPAQSQQFAPPQQNGPGGFDDFEDDIPFNGVQR